MPQRTCPLCSTPFTIHSDEEAFIAKMTFTFGEKTFHPALPIFCPDCRLKRRVCHRNEHAFYKRTSSLSKQECVSIYHPDPLWGNPDKVYTPEEWNADTCENLAYGRPYDFSRSFFDQFRELHKDVPRLGMITLSNVNSDFTAGTAYCKNCYLINSSEYCEDCLYGKLYQNCKSSLDCSYLYGSELCYDCFSVYDSYHCQHLSFCKNCRDCSYGVNLVGCKNCFLCSNLRQKEYCVKNRQVTKEEYEHILREAQGSYERTQAYLEELTRIRTTMIHRGANIVNSEGCTGDYIENSQNCFDCYDVNDSQDCRYVTVGVNVKDNYDCSNMYLKPELCYEVLGTIEVYNAAYCLFVFHSQNMLYSEYCFNCSDCFGCSGLRQKHYCIFNQQYTKEEYEELIPRIIAHMQATPLLPHDPGAGFAGQEWGKFFPPNMAAFGYNEALIGEYFPTTKDEALRQGFYWREVEEKMPQASRVIEVHALPENIGDVSDGILTSAILCQETRRPFKLQKQELDFYRSQFIPLPRLHPDVRYDRRLLLRNPRKLFARHCSKCGDAIQSTYAPERTETVVCEKCYLKEVY